MNAKFGSSQGLRSGPGSSMSGIGSDPNYNPGRSSGGGVDDITAQLGDVSQKAYSYFSSVWETTAKTVQEAHIIEQVSSTWGSLAGGSSNTSREQPVTFRSRDEAGSDVTAEPVPAADPITSGWSALSSGAAGWWQK